MKISDWPQSRKLLDLARHLADATVEARAAIDEAWLEARQCRAITQAGRRCRSFALWNSSEQLCASHLHKTRGPELTCE